MRILVMGAGGVGGYFGAKLACAGNEVGFIARGNHLSAIRDRGLKVICGETVISVRPAFASDNPSDFGMADIVLFCVKTFDAFDAAKAIRPNIDTSTGVIPLLNGIGHMQVLERAVDKAHLLGGVANISALIEAPGVIRRFGDIQFLRFGEMDDILSPRVLAFRKACIEAGFEAPAPKSIQREMWQKVIMICALAGVNCLTRLPLGICRSNPHTRKFMQALVREAVEVGNAIGVPLPPDQESRTMVLLDKLPSDMKASMLAALERGQRLEASAFSGAIDQLGKENGVATLAHRAVYSALAPHEQGATH